MIFIIWFAKLLKLILSLSTKGSGTALPGLIVEKNFPWVFEKLAAQIQNSIVITGTNGKTTTQTILASIIEQSGKTVIRNKSGSNLKRGLISNLIMQTNFWGRLKTDFAIYEIEEATMPKVIKAIKPKLIVVTNLFRDQLDAYGEIDRTQKFIIEAITQVPNSTVILNADDPRVTTITDQLPNKTRYYGLEEQYKKQFKYEGTASNQTKPIDTNVTNVVSKSDLGYKFSIDSQNYELNIPGLFQIYNAAAAITAAGIMSIPQDKISAGVAAAQPAFGRGEIIEKDGITYRFLLVKNPAGLNLSLSLLSSLENPNIVLALNDKIADGRDVSWIWDGNYELLNQIEPGLIVCTGTRAADMLLRIKYTLKSFSKLANSKYTTNDYSTEIVLVDNIDAIHKQVQQLLTNKNNKTVYVLPTYTAMLQLRKNILGKALNV